MSAISSRSMVPGPNAEQSRWRSWSPLISSIRPAQRDRHGVTRAGADQRRRAVKEAPGRLGELRTEFVPNPLDDLGVRPRLEVWVARILGNTLELGCFRSSPSEVIE